MAGASAYDTRVRAERRQAANPDAPDDFGNVESAWALLWRRWAYVRPERGREALSAARLESRVPALITLRRDPDTAALTAGDRLIFESGPNTGKQFEIISVIAADMAEVEFSGVIIDL